MFLTWPYTLTYTFLYLKGQTSQQNEKTCTTYGKMVNANDSSMNGTCNTFLREMLLLKPKRQICLPAASSK